MTPAKVETAATTPLGAGTVIRIEKNLSTLGYFTPSKSRGKGPLTQKKIQVKREVNGKLVVAEAAIVPSVEYGLPSTADQDKYLAFQKIVNDMRNERGVVSNPVSFSSSDILRILGQQQSGANYEDVRIWLERMVATTIRSKGTIYLAKRRVWAQDTFHVFDRVKTMGSELENGRLAEQNYVWMSSWQLENINENYVLPIDFDTYRKLKNNISKALVPLLQQWLYASRHDGRFEKRYDDLCSLLDLKKQKYRSDVLKQLEPSLSELQQFGYLSNWSIDETNDGREWKIVGVHGAKFFEDQKRLHSARAVSAEEDESPALLAALEARGISGPAARQLVRSLPLDQPVLDQLEYCDWLIRTGRFRNPAGFYVKMLRDNIPVPLSFETSTRRRLREQQELEASEREFRRLRVEADYELYLQNEINGHIERVLSAEAYEERVNTEIQTFLQEQEYKNLPATTVREIGEARVRRSLRVELCLLSMEEFSALNPQKSLFD